MNPYRAFRIIKPDEEIDYGVLVYKGDIHMEEVSGLSRAFQAWDKLDAKQSQDALKLAEEAVQLAPNHLYTEWALGDAAAETGKKDEARTAYKAAEVQAQKLDPQWRADYVKQIEDSVKKL
jgi:Flp pilus assembly protein TadD